MTWQDLRQFEEKMKWQAPEDFRKYVFEKYAFEYTGTVTAKQELWDSLMYKMHRYVSGALCLCGKTAKECLLEEYVQQLQKSLRKSHRLQDLQKYLQENTTGGNT